MATAAYAGPTYRLTDHDLIGGDVVYFERDFRNLAARGYKVIIDGTCLSSCTIGLKFKNVCVMPGSTLGFHTAKNYEDDQINRRGTAILQSAIPPELLKRLLPLRADYQYVKASELPARYLCKV